MKKLIPLLLLLTGCIQKADIPLRGNYPSPYSITTSKGFDEVWNNLIDLFATQGLPIKIIDRSSGLIISEKALIKATNERKISGLYDSTAYLILPVKWNIVLGKYMRNNEVVLNSIYGEWNVRIKKLDSGETLINVNIVNVQTNFGTYNNGWEAVSGCKSTGLFEKTIADLIK